VKQSLFKAARSKFRFESV